ncbi:hypothetical protein AG1IA_02268 [Rhizoctonia solani AG-1 IA]|uniref:Uncharacterized protein n=1 Tax=Thanatephorus cucumeris (strain AG1-IA) TaxID=983506 RepID=L8X0F2_THACA|nr:hypothetical protein AG1IA_02268 [Rhizoctonia solani AG-1 IA]
MSMRIYSKDKSDITYAKYIQSPNFGPNGTYSSISSTSPPDLICTWTEPGLSLTKCLIQYLHDIDNLFIFPRLPHDLDTYWQPFHLFSVVDGHRLI